MPQIIEALNLSTKIGALGQLGEYLNCFLNNQEAANNNPHYTEWFEKTTQAVALAERKNGWFTQANIHHALQYWANELTAQKLENWLTNYTYPSTLNQKSVGVIMAGNIPMVGFHDLLSVFLSGHVFHGKLSSDDQILIPHLIELLTEINHACKPLINFSAQFLKNNDAYIGTGSNNSSRYFEYYFRNKPHIIRGNRNGVAILQGKETAHDFELLGEDIFRYFGLGCRNVSKLFVPKGYDFVPFFEGIYSFHEMVNHNKYGNNHAYNRTVYLMNSDKLLDNNFLLIKEDESYSSPVAVLFYEYYDSMPDLAVKLLNDTNKLQCLLSANASIPGSIAFGKSQSPNLNEYADGVDTLKFLLNLHTA